MRNPFFFLHIPKTAGTTLNRIFSAKYSEKEICSVYSREENDSFAALVSDDLEQIKLVQGHIFVHDFDSFFTGPFGKKTFTFLRDPVSRVVSEYNFLLNWPKSQLYAYLNDSEISLTDYVTSMSPELVYRGKNQMTRSLCGDGDSSPEAMLERAKHNLQRMLFFGITEKFDESLLILKDLMDLENIFYERSNVRKKKSKVTEQELVVIREYNELDIKLYSFARELFKQRVDDLGDDFKQVVSRFKIMNDSYQRIAKLLMQKEADNNVDFINSK